MKDDDRNDMRSDDPLESLFDGIEGRPQPSAGARERAFDAVADEWEELLTRRRARWRIPGAVAAGVLVGIVGLVLLRQPAAPVPAVALELAHGHVRVHDVDYRAVRGPVPVQVDRDAPILALGPARWVAAGGADVRVGAGAEFAWRGAGTLSLDNGHVYVATDGGTTFAVATRHGVVTDIGTRFLVAANAGRFEVAVREGQVELARPDGTTRRTGQVAPGYAQVLVAEGGAFAERTEAATHARWNWVHTAPKGYATRDPVAMLREIARDLGRQLRFGPGVEAALRAEELDGDFTGLAPRPALRQVVNVTATDWREENGVITIVFDD